MIDSRLNSLISASDSGRPCIFYTAQLASAKSENLSIESRSDRRVCMNASRSSSSPPKPSRSLQRSAPPVLPRPCMLVRSAATTRIWHSPSTTVSTTAPPYLHHQPETPRESLCTRASFPWHWCAARCRTFVHCPRVHSQRRPRAEQQQPPVRTRLRPRRYGTARCPGGCVRVARAVQRLHA